MLSAIFYMHLKTAVAACEQQAGSGRGSYTIVGANMDTHTYMAHLSVSILLPTMHLAVNNEWLRMERGGCNITEGCKASQLILSQALWRNMKSAGNQD